MARYRTLLSSALLAASLGFAAAPAFANPQDCGPMWAPGEFRGHRAEQMEQHHKKLHALLKLTPEQEGAWKKMVDSEQAMPRMAPGKPEDWAKLTTPERAEKMLDQMKERQAHMVEHVAALKEFYGALTPEQKKTFDDFHSGLGGGMRGMGRHRGPGSGKMSPKP